MGDIRISVKGTLQSLVAGVLSLEIDRKEEDASYHDDLWSKRTPIHTKNYIE